MQRSLISICLLGLIIRWIAWASLGGQPIDDPGSYVAIAQNIISGRGMVIENETYGTLRAAFPPAYPFILALFGGQWLLLNAMLDLLATWAIYRLSNNPVAAAAYFLFPSVIMASIVPSKEALAVALVVILPLCRNPWVFGVVSGLLTLSQPAWAPIPIVFFVLTKREGWWKALLAFVLVMAPWWIRNALLFGQFVPLTSSAGLSLGVAVEGRHLSTLSIPGNEIDRASVVASAAFNQILADPLHYLVNVAKMVGRSFLMDEDAVEYLSWSKAPWLGAAAIIGQLAWMALLALAAFSRKRLPWWLTALLIAGAVSCFAGMWLEFSSRHRAFVVPLLILVAMRRGSPLPSMFPAFLRSHTSIPSDLKRSVPN